MSKITKSAKMEDCTIRLPNHCNHTPETVAFCHLDKIRFGKGMAIKSKAGQLDLGAYGCSSCHGVIHGEKTILDWRDVYIAHLEGTIETIMKLVEKGLVKL